MSLLKDVFDSHLLSTEASNGQDGGTVDKADPGHIEDFFFQAGLQRIEKMSWKIEIKAQKLGRQD